MTRRLLCLGLFALSLLGVAPVAYATCVNLDVYRCTQVPLKTGEFASIRAFRTLCSAPGGPVHQSKTLEIRKPDVKFEHIPLQNSQPQNWEGMILDLSMILSADENSEIGWVQLLYSSTEGSRFEIKYPSRTDLETDSEIYLKPEQCRFDSVR